MVGGSVAAEALVCVVLAEQLSAGRSDDLAEQGPALGSSSGLTRECPKLAPLFGPKNSQKKRPAQTLVSFGFPCYTRSTAVGMASTARSGLKHLRQAAIA